MSQWVCARKGVRAFVYRMVDGIAGRRLREPGQVVHWCCSGFSVLGVGQITASTAR